MDVAPVLELLRKKIGLNPESIGTASVEKSVREQIECSGAVSIEDYVNKVNGSVAELNRLIESVVVKETSFFRNTTPFIALHRYLKQFVLNKKDWKILRVLCLPCATGEEAYSIAMAFFDMKLSAKQFFIFAGDVSEQVLQIAKAGTYSPYSFRGEDIAFRERYFSKQAEGTYLLKKEVRDAVHFERVNILSGRFLPGQKPFDVIFCRNLLIYFDDAAKEKAIAALSQHLSDEGVLFVGHAEGANISPSGFASLDFPMSFAFARKKYAAVVNDVLNIDNHKKKSISSVAPVQRKVVKSESFTDTDKITPVKPERYAKGENEGTAKNIQIDQDISKVRQLAAAGSFGEVTAICERLLSEGVESAEIYYLLGQAADSTGDNLLAEEYLKKAIYLNADFYDALISLSFICGRMGNPDKAASLRRRAQRVKARIAENTEQ